VIRLNASIHVPLPRTAIHSVEDSPILTHRIEFTATALPDCLCYGRVVLSPLLPTPHCGDTVTVRYRTILHRTEADCHRSIPSPSQAHDCASPLLLWRAGAAVKKRQRVAAVQDCWRVGRQLRDKFSHFAGKVCSGHFCGF
jgi:hypothetical protein